MVGLWSIAHPVRGADKATQRVCIDDGRHIPLAASFDDGLEIDQEVFKGLDVHGMTTRSAMPAHVISVYVVTTVHEVIRHMAPTT